MLWVPQTKTDLAVHLKRSLPAYRYDENRERGPAHVSNLGLSAISDYCKLFSLTLYTPWAISSIPVALTSTYVLKSSKSMLRNLFKTHMTNYLLESPCECLIGALNSTYPQFHSLPSSIPASCCFCGTSGGLHHHRLRINSRKKLSHQPRLPPLVILPASKQPQHLSSPSERS